jgi:hypothetical protein
MLLMIGLKPRGSKKPFLERFFVPEIPGLLCAALLLAGKVLLYSVQEEAEPDFCLAREGAVIK